MIQTYTFGRCAALLDIDPKIFRGWVKNDLGLQEMDQVSKSDRRVRYLTRNQLEALATQHEIILPDEHQMQNDEEDTPQSMYKFLTDHVKSMKESLGEYVASLSVTRGMVSDLRDKTICSTRDQILSHARSVLINSLCKTFFALVVEYHS